LIEDFYVTAKQVANEMIDMSDLLASKLESWHKLFARIPESSSHHVSAGFITLSDQDSGIQMVVDVQASIDTDQTKLRIWAIESIVSADQTKIFNTIQLTFAIDYNGARTIVEADEAVTRNTLREILTRPSTELKVVVISNRSGITKPFGKLQGERHELTRTELQEHESDVASIEMALTRTLKALQASARAERSKLA
jgi:hypothetical protein